MICKDNRKILYHRLFSAEENFLEMILLKDYLTAEGKNNDQQ